MLLLVYALCIYWICTSPARCYENISSKCLASNRINKLNILNNWFFFQKFQTIFTMRRRRQHIMHAFDLRDGNKKGFEAKNIF